MNCHDTILSTMRTFLENNISLIIDELPEECSSIYFKLCYEFMGTGHIQYFITDLIDNKINFIISEKIGKKIMLLYNQTMLQAAKNIIIYNPKIYWEPLNKINNVIGSCYWSKNKKLLSNMEIKFD